MTLEEAAVALFEAHRDAGCPGNLLEWADLQIDLQQRYRRTAALMLTNLNIPYTPGDPHAYHPRVS